MVIVVFQLCFQFPENFVYGILLFACFYNAKYEAEMKKNSQVCAMVKINQLSDWLESQQFTGPRCIYIPKAEFSVIIVNKTEGKLITTGSPRK